MDKTDKWQERGGGERTNAKIKTNVKFTYLGSSTSF